MVVIDTGHGGKDPGAKAVDGTYEKNYNIDVARRLDRKLKEIGFNTIMTREEDLYTTLQERADAANWNYADFFVSIHFNAYMNKAKGIETLYYPNTPTEAYSINNKDIA
ncbi:MAG: N-acetylmuramoyl-L-alanine amidase, partial [Clostridiales bacterium]|nr:N-acetylmuramoyl-L-alanine amidase [Clostridiales bacterium]